MTDLNVEDYMGKISVDKKPTPVNKKRKRSTTKTDSENNELRSKAKFYCSCPEQWRSVSKYSEKRMSDFVHEREFDNERNLHDSIFDFAVKILGTGLDIIMKGNSHIKNEIECDENLKQAIRLEGSNFVSYLNNRFKIISLTAIDVFNGKQKQKLLDPPPETIEEIIINGDHEGANDSSKGQQNMDREDVIFTTTTSESIEEEIETETA